MASKRPSIAVVVLTFNEDKNIDDCLDSVGDWAEEIFVVDSYSTDATIDRLLARNNPRPYVVQHPFVTHSEQWNWAIDNLLIKSEWTLKLDADERVPSEFKDEVDRRLQVVAPGVEGFLFKRSTVFLGRRLRYVGVLRHDLRLWRTGTCRFDGSSMNEHAVVAGSTGVLQARIDHHDNKSVTEWLNKHNRYASIMAMAYVSREYKNGIHSSLFGNTVERTKFLERLYLRMPFRPLIIFIYMYAIKLGFVDGGLGFHYCMLRSLYFYLIDLKMLESRLTGSAPEVVYPPRGQPDPRLANGPKA